MDGSSVTSASTNYQYERAPISSAPVDAIQEFSVESTGMKAGVAVRWGRSTSQPSPARTRSTAMHSSPAQ